MWNWRVVLLVGAVLMIALASVGFTLDVAAVQVRGTADPAIQHQEWPAPFSRVVWYRQPGGRRVITEGDARIWYFAAGAVVLFTIASLPLLRDREARARGKR